MKLKREDLLLYAITDRSWLREGETLASVTEEILAAGATCLQLREKHAGREELLALCRELLPICRKYGVPFIVNDDVEVCRLAGADGVHVGQSDMAVRKAREILGPDKIIGTSAHNVAEAKAALEAGADYIGCGAVFGSSTKTDATTLSHDELYRICREVPLPAVAIGGIHLDNVVRLSGTVIDGVAVISDLYQPADHADAARRMREAAGRVVHGFSRDRKMRTALTIAGSDSSGGAGIQADLKTMTCNGVYGMSAICALTAQNTTGVQGIMEVSPEFLRQQLDSVFTDIYPDAVKTGMVSSTALIETIVERLSFYSARNLVVDPVMVATSGARLISEEAVDTLKNRLLPISTLITPNIPEAEVLSGMAVKSADDMIRAAKAIHDRYGCAVLCKGGHQLNDANDLLYRDGDYRWFEGRRIQNSNTHGTGCTLSSAIASNLAKGMDLDDAVAHAKAYISGALAAMLDLGSGSGPMNHAFAVKGEY